jgi:hypothetical protein
MLEWRPRLIATLAVVVLVAIAVATGYFTVSRLNWEW